MVLIIFTALFFTVLFFSVLFFLSYFFGIYFFDIIFCKLFFFVYYLFFYLLILRAAEDGCNGHSLVRDAYLIGPTWPTTRSPIGSKTAPGNCRYLPSAPTRNIQPPRNLPKDIILSFDLSLLFASYHLITKK